MTWKTDGFSVAGGMWRRLSRRDIGRQVVPGACGNNREGAFGDTWRAALLVSDWVVRGIAARVRARLCTPWTAILNWTRSGKRSQCRQINASVIWSVGAGDNVSCIAAFTTNWTRRVRHTNKLKALKNNNRATAGRIARCRCKVRYILNFTTAYCGYCATERLSCKHQW